MIGKNTAELTASDMSKFMKWWMQQPIREDLYDMKKKKQATQKKAEVKKVAAKQTKKENVPMKKGTMVVTKADVKKLNVSGLTGKHALDVQHGARTGRIVNKEAVKKAVTDGFEKFRQKKEEERKQQLESLPTPVDVDQIDDSVAEELNEQYRNRQWKSAKAQTEEEEEEIIEKEDPEEMNEDELEEFIEENIEVVDDERAKDSVDEEFDETEQQEEINIEALPPDDEEVCKMGLTALDVEALRYVLVEAMRVSTEGAFQIPEEYLLTIESILDGLN
jgi:hypothetical protein